MSFSFSWIRVGTKNLISTKQINNIVKNIGWLFVSQIIAILEFWLWVNYKKY